MVLQTKSFLLIKSPVIGNECSLYTVWFLTAGQMSSEILEHLKVLVIHWQLLCNSNCISSVNNQFVRANKGVKSSPAMPCCNIIRR